VQQLGRYWDERDRRTSPDIYANIASLNADGSYMVRRQDNNELVRATASNLGVTYKPGTVVICVNPGASGLNRNTGLTIIGFPGTALKNASGAPVTGDSFSTSGSAVLSITPNPVNMWSGQTVAVTIRGAGFTAAPTYSSPLLTNASAPVVTATQITLSVKADEAIAAGTYGLTLDGKTYNVFQISKLSGHIYFIEWQGGELKKLNPTDGTLIANVAAFTAATLLAEGDTFIYVTGVSGTHKLRRFRKSDLVQDSEWPNNAGGADQNGVALFAENRFFWSFTNGLNKVNWADGSQAAAAIGAVKGGIYDGTWIWCAGGDKIYRVNPSDLTFTQTTLTGTSLRHMATDGTYLYVLTNTDAGDERALKISKSPVAIVATYTGLTEPRAIQYHEGFLLITNKSEVDPGEVVKLRASDMSHVQTVNATEPIGYSALVAELDLLWVTSGNSGLGDDNTVLGFDTNDLSLDFVRTHSASGDNPYQIIRAAS